MRIAIRASEPRNGGVLWSILVYGSVGCFVLSILKGLAIAKLDAPDELARSIGAVEFPPMALGRVGEVEDHGQRGVA